MKTLQGVLPVVVLALVGVAFVPASADVPALTARPMPPLVLPSAAPSAAPVALPTASSDDVAKLALYVETALRTWTKHSREQLVPLDGVASDIASVVLDPTEPAVLEDNGTKARTAILLATITFFEGGELLHVANGDCNDRTWRHSNEGRAFVAKFPCDGGYAYGLGQVHPEGGIVLTPDGEWQNVYDAPPGSVAIDGPTMIARRDLSFRVVLHMLRKSLRRTGGLSGYSGEGESAPKAKARLDFARAWSLRHPF